jgi:hypothetical protein
MNIEPDLGTSTRVAEWDLAEPMLDGMHHFITQLGHQPHRAFELNTEVAESRGDFELLGGHRDQDSAACKKSIEADHSMSGRVNLCSSILDRR